MKRYSLGLVLLVLTLALGTAAFAVFPVPDSTATFTVQQGFGPNGQIVWFFCTDTNSIGYASTMQYPFKTPTLAPPLLSAYNEGLQPTNGRKMYINVCMQQGPVFNRLPGDNNYGGVWSVIFIKFLPGKCRRVCNLDPFDAVTNPFGFPITAGPNKQADLLSSYGTIQTGTVLDCPIVAVGTFPTSGPWFHGPGSNSNPSVFYRLEQVIAYNAYYKTVTLPAWYVFCQDFITKYINRCTLIIPDASTLKLANRLKANYAPGLNNIDSDNFQKFFFIDGRGVGRYAASGIRRRRAGGHSEGCEPAPDHRGVPHGSGCAEHQPLLRAVDEVPHIGVHVSAGEYMLRQQRRTGKMPLVPRCLHGH